MQQGFVIRPFAPGEPRDRLGIRAVFELTGLFGEPVARYFHRPAFITDTMVEYYLRFERPWAFVAEETATRHIAGYITGCPDTRARDRRAVTWTLPMLAASYLRNGLLTDRAGWGIALRGLPEQIREALGVDGGPDLTPYPAHLHMAVHPGHQRRGLGIALLTTLLDRLREAAVFGIHLATTNHHQAAVALYERHGFLELARHRTRAFDHLLPASMLPVERIIMGRRLAAAGISETAAGAARIAAGAVPTAPRAE